MLKLIFISSFLFLTFLSCQKNNTIESFNYKKDSPIWLKEKIDSISENEKYYFGTKIYRYELNGQFIYHFSIPASSCVYCESYDQNGKIIQLDNEMVNDFVNKVLVWEWKE